VADLYALAELRNMETPAEGNSSPRRRGSLMQHLNAKRVAQRATSRGSNPTGRR
jgi:hypothetical protein